LADTFKPETDEQVREVVAWAISDQAPLEVVSRGTKRAIGRPLQTSHTLDLSGLSGLRLYEPEELILQAGPGTPLAEIEAALADANQMMAFEPMDYGPLLGTEPGAGSIGGVFAANLAGPRRAKAGAARDHLLGFTGVTGRGEIVKSGGRVVKNVTGYDLSKLVCGSWGTLTALTDVILKVLPKPEAETTVLIHGLDDRQATRAMSQAMGSSHEVSSAAHVPSGLTAANIAGPATLIRVEGFGPSVEARVSSLTAELGGFGEISTVTGEQTHALWRAIRDALPLVEPRDQAVWKLSVPPMAGPAVVEALRVQVPDARALYDWAGGLVWLAVPAAADAHATDVRGAMAAVGEGGHATLIRAPADVRAAIPVFEPQAPGLAGVTKRLKDSFDPSAILNPGRMTAGV
jgi:glycolate oxidase FAD binding subunit